MARDDQEELKRELNKCMMTHQLGGCLGGVLLGIPISLRRKSYYPFAILGVLGTFFRQLIEWRL